MLLLLGKVRPSMSGLLIMGYSSYLTVSPHQSEALELLLKRHTSTCLNSNDSTSRNATKGRLSWFDHTYSTAASRLYHQNVKNAKATLVGACCLDSLFKSFDPSPSRLEAAEVKELNKSLAETQVHPHPAV